MRNRILPVLYPFILSIYPIVNLHNHNIDYVTFASVIRTLVLAIGLTAVLLASFHLLFRDIQKATLSTTIVLIAFFSFGHIYLASSTWLGSPIRYSWLFLIFLFIVIAMIHWIRSRKSISPQTSVFLFVTAIISIAIPVSQIIYHGIRVSQVLNDQPQPQKVDPPAGASSLPDIYLIILDSHTRSGVLQETFGHDDRAFLQGLRDLGFYVAECSQSNYPTTKFSVSSLMNMNYLQDEFPSQEILPPLSASRVSQQLRSMGYTFLRFEHYSESHFDLKEDILLSRNDAPLRLGLFTQGMNEFEAMMVETTALRVFFDMPTLLPGVDFSRAKYREHYLQTQYILETLPQIPDTKSPRFVYAHLLVPHDPYIFAPDGQYKETTSTIRGYRGNVQFIDQAILPVLKNIIENSQVPPIILLQGDHGPSGKIVTPEMRLAILNAYYVSQDAAANLYPTITPVNSFRVIFNEYFDGSYPILEDRSYYAYETTEFNPEFIIPNTCTPSGLQ